MNFLTRLISVTEKVWESDSTDASDTEETKRAPPPTAKPTKPAVSDRKNRREKKNSTKRRVGRSSNRIRLQII